MRLCPCRWQGYVTVASSEPSRFSRRSGKAVSDSSAIRTAILAMSTRISRFRQPDRVRPQTTTDSCVPMDRTCSTHPDTRPHAAHLPIIPSSLVRTTLVRHHTTSPRPPRHQDQQAKVDRPTRARSTHQTQRTDLGRERRRRTDLTTGSTEVDDLYYIRQMSISILSVVDIVGWPCGRYMRIDVWRLDV